LPAQELARPAVDVVAGVEILAFDRAQQVGALLCAVGDRIGAGVILDLEFEGVAGE
jgi:hypothetical protein